MWHKTKSLSARMILSAMKADISGEMKAAIEEDARIMPIWVPVKLSSVLRYRLKIGEKAPNAKNCMNITAESLVLMYRTRFGPPFVIR